MGSPDLLFLFPGRPFWPGSFFYPGDKRIFVYITQEIKRIVLILLVLLYAIPAIGVTVKMHYCGGKMTSVSLGFETAHKCGCKGKTMKKGCCSDKTAVLKLDTEQQRPATLKLNPVKFTDLKFIPDHTVHISGTCQISRVHTGSYHHPPDGVPQPPSYLVFQVFRI